MALKKSDLYSSLWKGADELRGGMDASQYKDYVLTLLFVKYVTDKSKSDLNSLIDIPDGGSFDDLVSFKGDKEIGDKMNKSIAKLAEANDLQSVINLADFNDEEKLGKGKEMQDRLTNLISIFQDLDFSGSRAEGDDLLGDAYEYLMRHFATESGKSKGQFYTPAEVSRVMAQLIGISADTPFSATVYDPTCGSGSLLLKVADAAPNGLTIYGQEKDNATWALAKMNMILHDNEIADIRKGDTITNPKFVTNDRLDTFDYLVANPPFSVKSWSSGLENEFGRFDGFGRPPEKNGDFAFLLHMLKSLKSEGKGAVILPHGVLFRGNAEGIIRKEIVKRGYIKGIIGLPTNLFYGTGIPACIVVIDKEKAQSRNGIFMINASQGFEKDGAKNRLRPRDMHKIVDVFTNELEVPGYSRMVQLSEIQNEVNDFNLNIPRYIESSDQEDLQDLHGHLFGGIPNRDIDALGGYWAAIPALKEELFVQLREGYFNLAVPLDEVQNKINESAEYQAFIDETKKIVRRWWGDHRESLISISQSKTLSEFINSLSENLLELFRGRPLIDEYEVYEQLMVHWHRTMYDDLTLIRTDGWDGAAKPRKTIEDKNRKISEIPDLVIGTGKNAQRFKMDLIPPSLIVEKYFPDEKTVLIELNDQLNVVSQSVEEFVEENSGDEGALAGFFEDGKISKNIAVAQLRIARAEDPDGDEVGSLLALIGLFEAEAKMKKTLKAAAVNIDENALGKYGQMSTSEIQTLAIDAKWGPAINDAILEVVDRSIKRFVERIADLGKRYNRTLTELETEVELQSRKVRESLSSMGIL